MCVPVPPRPHLKQKVLVKCVLAVRMGPGFLSLSTTHILGGIVFLLWGCPVQRGMLAASLAPFIAPPVPPEVVTVRPIVLAVTGPRDIQMCLQPLAAVPGQRSDSTPVENRCDRQMKLPKRDEEDKRF